MRSVASIKLPRLGKFVHVRTPQGAVHAGKVMERRANSRGRAYFVLDTGAQFRPEAGDRLTYLSDHAKAKRGELRGDSLAQALLIAQLRRERNRFAFIVGILAGLLTLAFVSG